MLDALEVGIIVLGPDGTVGTWNAWIARHSGISAYMALGRSLPDLFSEVRPGARFLAAVTDAIEKRRAAFLSQALHKAPLPLHPEPAARARGERIAHAVHVRPVQSASGGRGALIQIVDMSSSVARELALREKTEEAELARNAQRDFLARMSHELRTPMNGVIALCELLLGTDLDNEQRTLLKTVYHSGQSLLGILNDVLDLSKIVAGKMTIEAIPTDVALTLREVEGILRAKADATGIELSTVVESTMPRGLTVDPLRLRQVLLNLVGNAVKFTERGGVKVTATTRRVDAHSLLLRISVEDTGIGILEPEALFKEFVQGDSSISRRFGGTGLGLSISKRLVELMGGSIQVTSTPGVGSTFQVEVPVAHADAPHSMSPGPVSIWPGATALVVDDNRVNRMVAEKILERMGLRVEVAENGAEALQLACSRNYDVILMDCHMPVMDGYEATSRIRKELGRTTPIIAVTADAMPGEREHCLRAGMDDYITKPLTLGVIREVLGRYLNPGGLA